MPPFSQCLVCVRGSKVFICCLTKVKGFIKNLGDDLQVVDLRSLRAFCQLFHNHNQDVSVNLRLDFIYFFV